MSDTPFNPTLGHITEIYQKYAWEREMRLSTGIGLHVTELRLRDADQVSALGEHVERAVPVPGVHLTSALFGIPIMYDDSVPAGVARLVYEDGSTSQVRLA